jgi:hypothetical protein
MTTLVVLQFAPFLSVLDLILNEGSRSLCVLSR